MGFCSWVSHYHMILYRNGSMRPWLVPSSKGPSQHTVSTMVLLNTGSSMPWLGNSGHFLKFNGGVGGLMMNR
ncbi:hypothetical protein ID866_13189 [Astraeus odoratus]|nr:hypothetical protein ID866_13189 [Astraeus odoratus]